MPFREDINALRAIAVLSVVFYHFSVPGLTGGFSGVDVFFVISGFLMTDIILKKYARKILIFIFLRGSCQKDSSGPIGTLFFLNGRGMVFSDAHRLRHTWKSCSVIPVFCFQFCVQGGRRLFRHAIAVQMAIAYMVLVSGMAILPFVSTYIVSGAQVE